MKAIQKSIVINAPKEKVWKVLLNDEHTRNWYSVFSEGTHADTDWEQGSKAIFTDNSQSGMVSKVIINQPYETLLLEYQGIVVDGKEDYESDLARAVNGGRESYHLTEKDNNTELSISCDMDESLYDDMSKSWEKALEKIKGLAETL